MLPKIKFPFCPHQGAVFIARGFGYTLHFRAATNIPYILYFH